MKNNFHLPTFILTGVLFLFAFLAVHAFTRQDKGYIIDHEKDIAVTEAGPHNGTGSTTAYSFFSKVKDAKMTFRKRVLPPGSSIGYHLQEKQEIYYIISGNGELVMNGKVIPATTGDAILMFPGCSVGLKPVGNTDLQMFIVYENN